MDATEFVSRYIDAWNRRDAQAVAGHVSEQGTYLDIRIDQEMNREELLAHLEELFRLESYRYELVGEVCAGADTIAFQYRAVPRDGGSEEQSWHGAEFITLSKDEATEIVDYYEQRGVASPQSPIADAAGPGKVQRYAKSGLGAQQLDELKARLRELMDTERVFLKPDLTLPELADALDCSVNHLSQAINAGFGMSFFDYVNRHRVEAAIDLLDPAEGESPTVLDVALQVGFNSTSTFYVAFRKATGKTPAQYRKDLAEGVAG